MQNNPERPNVDNESGGNNQWTDNINNTERDNAIEISSADLKAFQERMAEARIETAKYAVDLYKDECISCRNQFRNYLSKNEKGISSEEFQKWEDDYDYNYTMMQNNASKAGFYPSTIPYYDVVENPIKAFSELPGKGIEADTYTDNTIEAVAGDFYFDRIKALRQAIDSSDDPDADSGKRSIGGFWGYVREHVYYKLNRGDLLSSDTFVHKRYERNRTRAHNDVIEELNRLNDLCRKYGVRPLTVRNFVSTKNGPIKTSTGGLERRQRYDRDIVESYYARAFGREIGEEQAKESRRSDYYGQY